MHDLVDYILAIICSSNLDFLREYDILILSFYKH